MPSSAWFTRRRLLRGALRASTMALLPPHLQRALAQAPTRAGTLADIRHVVLLMQENRSFDHYFGTLAGVRGFGDPNALRLAEGRSVFHQPDAVNPLGYLLPFHLDTATSSAQKLPSTSHAWAVQHQAWNGGRMDQWVSAHRQADGARGPYTMGYFERADIPFHHALAEAFTLCDAYHASVMGPTWPNRLYAMTGTIDAEGMDGGPMIRNQAPADGLRWGTYAERLQQAGVPWRVYEHSPKGRPFNMLKLFARFRDAPAGAPLRARGLPAPSEDEFEWDVRHDRLPAVSWLLPPFAASEHPDAMPAAGANFIARKLDALAANPRVWARTALILNYDENDGLFDHVPPPVPPAGTPGEFVGGLPIGGGFRVPCILISPWTAGGWVCSQPFDHTSVLQFLERVTGVREPNITDWRRRTFGDLTSAFRFRESSLGWPALPDAAPLLQRARQEVASLPAPLIPQADQSLPQQAPGSRRSVPR
ncbi:alkaline phosphatase family protein [Ottowia pentelensis]